MTSVATRCLGLLSVTLEVRLVTLAVTLVTGAVIAGAGCASEGSTSRSAWHPDSWSFQRHADEPRVFAVDSPIGIDVSSFGGDVIVEADARLAEAAVTVERVATHGYGRKKEAEASLPQIEYSIELVPGEVHPVLQVRTWTSHAEPHFQRAHVRIDLPHADGVTVRTRRGLVTLVDVEGAVDVETSDADVRVMTNLAMRKPVTIVNRDGSIDYRVRGESEGVFDCQAVRGEVDHRVLYGRFTVASIRPDLLNATLNFGTNPIVLRTVDGDIRIAVVPDPTRIGAKIVDP